MRICQKASAVAAGEIRLKDYKGAMVNLESADHFDSELKRLKRQRSDANGELMLFGMELKIKQVPDSDLVDLLGHAKYHLKPHFPLKFFYNIESDQIDVITSKNGFTEISAYASSQNSSEKTKKDMIVSQDELAAASKYLEGINRKSEKMHIKNDQKDLNAVADPGEIDDEPSVGELLAWDENENDDKIQLLKTILESEEPGTKLQELLEEGTIENLFTIPEEYLRGKEWKQLFFEGIVDAWQTLDFLFKKDFDAEAEGNSKRFKKFDVDYVVKYFKQNPLRKEELYIDALYNQFIEPYQDPTNELGNNKDKQFLFEEVVGGVLLDYDHYDDADEPEIIIGKIVEEQKMFKELDLDECMKIDMFRENPNFILNYVVRELVTDYRDKVSEMKGYASDPSLAAKKSGLSIDEVVDIMNAESINRQSTFALLNQLIKKIDTDLETEMADFLKIDQALIKQISNWSMINAFIKRSYPHFVEQSTENEIKQFNTFIKEAILFEHIGQLLFNDPQRFRKKEDVKEWLEVNRAEILEQCYEHLDYDGYVEDLEDDLDLEKLDTKSQIQDEKD